LLKAALEDGTVSRPTRFEMRVESSGLLSDAGGLYPALVRQPFLAELNRLIVFELLIHHLDTLQFLLGPIEVHAAKLERQCPAVNGEDYAQIELSAGGVPGVLIGDFCRSGRPAEIEDRLTFDDGEAVGLNGWTLNIPGKKPYVIDPQRGYVESYARTIDHFRWCLQTGARFETPAPDGVRLLEIVDTVYRLASAQTSRTI
jgi:predicted dehydrogenase